MEYFLADQDSFYIAGIAIRTTNENEQSSKDIGGLWTRFTSENISAQIPDKLSDDTYCVYTDYENDHTGWYTAVIGCKVAEPVVVPGLVSAPVPEGKYRMYKPEGKFPDCVAATWRYIWQDVADRKYIADYDLYKAGAKSFEEIETEIYVGVV